MYFLCLLAFYQQRHHLSDNFTFLISIFYNPIVLSVFVLLLFQWGSGCKMSNFEYQFFPKHLLEGQYKPLQILHKLRRYPYPCSKVFFFHTLVLDQYTYITILLISRIGILIYTRFFIFTSALPVAIHGVFIKTTLLVDSYTPTLDDMLIATSLMFLCLLMFAMFFPNNSLFIGFCSQYHVHVYIQFHLCFLIEFD